MVSGTIFFDNRLARHRHHSSREFGLKRLPIWTLVLLLLVFAGCGESKKFSKPYAKQFKNSLEMNFVLISGGDFKMGSALATAEIAKRFECKEEFMLDEQPPHLVSLTQPYYIGVTEVTQGQWEAIMGTRPWADSESAGNGSNFPATYVTYEDVNEFCRRLSKKEGLAYRLPTEAEWEFAARGGTKSVFFFGDDPKELDAYGWHSENSSGAQQVAQLKPNAFGLYDTCGNVFEWCSDWHSENYYSQSPKMDPTGPASGERKVKRGGSWFNTARFCRSAFRDDTVLMKSASDVGFRIVLEIDK
ncbi:MAG: SUMF1/EgtB/PvdO family nonheme iron enzyme [Planctomycetota bacterium]